jgi:chromosome segregation ATPase
LDSDSSVIAPLDWLPVERHFSQLRAERDELLELLERSYEELDQWRADLHGREQALDADREDLEQRREELARQHAALREAQAAGVENAEHLTQSLNESQAELERLRRDSKADREAVAEARAELETLRGRAAESETEAARVADELAQHRELLASARAELAAAREQQQTAEAQLEARLAAARQTEADDAQAAALREQCELLETELETVRERTAELSDTLARNEREMAERRAQWELEREQLRRLVEQREHAPAPAAPAPAPAASPADDWVVGSVAAQFARLSRERADRRAREKQM